MACCNLIIGCRWASKAARVRFLGHAATTCSPKKRIGVSIPCGKGQAGRVRGGDSDATQGGALIGICLGESGKGIIPTGKGSRQREDGFAGCGRQSLEGYAESEAELGHEPLNDQHARLVERRGNWRVEECQDSPFPVVFYAGSRFTLTFFATPCPIGSWRLQETIWLPWPRSLATNHSTAPPAMRGGLRLRWRRRRRRLGGEGGRTTTTTPNCLRTGKVMDR
jgi:hypothetical protein